MPHSITCQNCQRAPVLVLSSVASVLCAPLARPDMRSAAEVAFLRRSVPFSQVPLSRLPQAANPTMTLVEGRVTPLSSICRELSLGCARQGATCRAAVGTTQRRNTGKVSVCRSQLGEAADSPLPYRQSLTLVKATRNVRAAFRGAASDEESHFSTSTRSALGHHSPGLGDRPSSSVSGRPPQCQLPSAAAASRGPRQGDAPGKAQASRVATANGTPTPRRSAASAQPAAGRRPGGAQEAAVWDPVSAAALTADAARALELFVQLRNEGAGARERCRWRSPHRSPHLSPSFRRFSYPPCLPVRAPGTQPSSVLSALPRLCTDETMEAGERHL